MLRTHPARSVTSCSSPQPVVWPAIVWCFQLRAGVSLVAMSFHVFIRCFVAELKVRADKTSMGPKIFRVITTFSHPLMCHNLHETLLSQTCEVNEGGMHVAAAHNRALDVPDVHLQQAAGRIPRIIRAGRTLSSGSHSHSPLTSAKYTHTIPLR
jgi:hypothetical protein